MARKEQLSPYSFFLAVEGTVTEKDYFNDLSYEKEKSRDYTVSIYPSESDEPNQPINLVRKAQENLEVFDECWAIFDYDDRQNLSQVYNLASQNINGKKINIGFSSRSFEYWILLHFEKNTKNFTYTDCKDERDHSKGCKMDPLHECGGNLCLCGYLRHSMRLGDYGKTSGYTLYENTKGRIETALINASWIKHYVTQAGASLQQPWTINPYTDIDVLIYKLLKKEYAYSWRLLNNQFTVNNILYTVTADNGLVDIHIVNNSQSAIIYNEANFEGFFAFLNQSYLNVPISWVNPIPKKVLLNPMEAIKLKFAPAADNLDAEYFLINNHGEKSILKI